MKLKLHTQIFISIVLGVLCGFIPGVGSFVAPLGDIFIRLLKMIIVPLVMSSMVIGIVGLKSIDEIRRLGMKTFGLFVVTTLLSITIGLVLTSIIEPGLGANIVPNASSAEVLSVAPPSMSELIIGIVPKNIFKSLVNGDMLSIIFFSLFLGAVLNILGKKASVLQSFFTELDQAMIKITDVIMSLAPIGVFALMASIVSKTGFDAFLPLGKYIVCVLLGLIIHTFVTLPALVCVVGQLSPKSLVKKMLPALGTAFSTSSSSATLPVTMDCLIKNVGISNRIVGFSIPLGTTMNMDGTALYQSVACLFIAQVYGIEIGLSKMVIIAITTTLASIGAAGIPSAGLVTMTIIMGAVGVPIEGIGLILAVDRVLDMVRTAVNVWGNVSVTAILAKLQGEQLNS